MASQTLRFSIAGIAGPAAMVQRLGDEDAGVTADYRRLIRVGLAAHGR